MGIILTLAVDQEKLQITSAKPQGQRHSHGTP